MLVVERKLDQVILQFEVRMVQLERDGHDNILVRDICQSLWVINIRSDSSWSWRNILNLRDLARERIRSIIGNGESISLWYDDWHPIGLLS